MLNVASYGTVLWFCHQPEMLMKVFIEQGSWLHDLYLAVRQVSERGGQEMNSVYSSFRLWIFWEELTLMLRRAQLTRWAKQ